MWLWCTIKITKLYHNLGEAAKKENNLLRKNYNG